MRRIASCSLRLASSGEHLASSFASPDLKGSLAEVFYRLEPSLAAAIAETIHATDGGRADG